MNDFWNRDVFLGEMEIGRRKKEIRLKAHISREEFYNTRSEILDCLNNSKYRTLARYVTESMFTCFT